MRDVAWSLGTEGKSGSERHEIAKGFQYFSTHDAALSSRKSMFRCGVNEDSNSFERDGGVKVFSKVGGEWTGALVSAGVVELGRGHAGLASPSKSVQCTHTF
jgi:hypothetical protein